MLCTTQSCSSSLTLIATLVRERERHSARFEPRGSAQRLSWRLLRGAPRTMPTTSPTAGIDQSANRVAECRTAVVRHWALLPNTDRWIC